MFRYLFIFATIVTSFGLISCEDTNVTVMTGAVQDAVTAITLTGTQVKNLAKQAAQASDKSHRIAASDSPYAKRLSRLVETHSFRDGNEFNFQVYLTQQVNAFAMADGSVRIYSGLMDLMNNEELLFVIGHEMGHVVNNHSKKKVLLTYASSALRKGLASQNNELGQIAQSVVGAFAEQLTKAQFSQHEEREADDYGSAFVIEQGYQIGGAVSALKKLALIAKNKHTFLSSHPNPQSRAERLISLARQQHPGKEQKRSYLTELLAYGKEILNTIREITVNVVNWLMSLF